jgi:hypothetical protein
MLAIRHLARPLALVAAGALALSGCRATDSAAHAGDRPIDPVVKRAADYLTGVFSSYEQSVADPEYFHIRLVCTPIWEHRTDGIWLYVEQAAAGSFDAPYRQRVYHVVGGGEVVVSEVYTLGDPEAVIGAWRDGEPLADLDPSALTRRDGCEIVLVAVAPDEFRGSTVEKNCPSDLRGASYATSTVVLRENRLDSWDQGFDANGEQVWGAVKGPYQFLYEGEPSDL